MQKVLVGNSIEMPQVSMPVREQRLAMARSLSVLAIARQTTLSEECAKVYLSSLVGFDLRDVEVAVDKLAKEPRREYAPAFPELGSLIAAIEEAAVRRRAASHGKFQACADCYDGMILTTARGLDGRPERAFAECTCRIAWKAAKQEAALRI